MKKFAVRLSDGTLVPISQEVAERHAITTPRLTPFSRLEVVEVDGESDLDETE